eukprot:CAMPEP_0118923962 /NCGR_PEP_ID=MMETSP1169-20130426/2303_1 /TAXON_ID=36882 /ORGANISM="Pyramimonas obovata, Strain CCMP722" /LENGTH=213 /DNA_ID=CAMNT_0006865031 /DNA_START=1 /DNA_END=639 /DNA_ORIENTATION=-
MDSPRRGWLAMLCLATTLVLGRSDLGPITDSNATNSTHGPALTLETTSENSAGCTASCKGITQAVTCYAGCDGIDFAICKGTEYIACKGGCLGIHKCVHKCEEKIVKPCERELVKKCHNKCEADVVKPCEKKCNASGHKLCVKLFEELVSAEGCHELCSEVVAAAESAAGGPLNPVADALAFALGSACVPTCSAALKEGLVPGTQEFAEFMCK